MKNNQTIQAINPKWSTYFIGKVSKDDTEFTESIELARALFANQQ